MAVNESIASWFSPPIKTLSGYKRSWIAVPSAKNSGLDKTSKEQEFELFDEE